MGCLKFFFILLSMLVARGYSVVQTSIGPVQGKMVASSKVEAFLGIPYAEPPVGPLRFSKPVPKSSWQEVFDATRLPPACIQVKYKDVPFAPDSEYMSEDCLYLNLWVPRSQITDDLKTIMLFIHGGALLVGSSNIPLYDGAKLAEHGNVIVATINYRLGALGFFTDFTEDAPGSLGMYDQLMAIKWIKENAKNFNGNPENIVLFGESAGSWSVSFHQISPLSKNLFKRAILQSGTSLSPIYDDNNTRLINLNQMYVKHLGCAGGGEAFTNTLDCLRNVPSEKFSETDWEIFTKNYKFPIPRIGNDFLPESTIDAFRNGHFKNSDILLGITKDEGPQILIGQRPDLYGLYGEKVDASMFNETTTYNAIKSMIENSDTAEIDKIIRGYMNDVKYEGKKMYLNVLSKAAGDFIVICGKIFQAEYQSFKGNPVFFYMFDHRPTSSPLSDWMGVSHFDEVQFIFGNPMHGYFTEYETELSRDMMDMWITFAKTGNPNIPGGMSWPKYTHKNPKYFIIGKKDGIGIRPDHYRCERWRNLYRSNIDKDVIEALKQS